MRNLNSSPAPNPLMYNVVLPARYVRAMVAQNLYESPTNNWLKACSTRLYLYLVSLMDQNLWLHWSYTLGKNLLLWREVSRHVPNLTWKRAGALINSRGCKQRHVYLCLVPKTQPLVRAGDRTTKPLWSTNPLASLSIQQLLELRLPGPWHDRGPHRWKSTQFFLFC